MLLTRRDDQPSWLGPQVQGSRLHVCWQDPESREIRPVGVLSSRSSPEEGERYDFRYVENARRAPFVPFLEFPELERHYQADALFAMFENRLMPRHRPDYPAYVEGLGLQMDAAPFEVLTASFGIRATDTVEVFQEPVVDSSDGLARCRFLAHGVRHVPGAAEAIHDLTDGQALVLLTEPDNPSDERAVVVATTGGRRLGYVPAYLLTFLHRAAEAAGGLDAVAVTVDGCDPAAPFHLRLLCLLRAPMPPEGFADPSLEPIVPWDH